MSKKAKRNLALFAEVQTHMFESSYEEKMKSNTEPVECLGITFDNDEARRTYFLQLLQEKLQDPEFRKTPGFPQGSDEDILHMSDPPYYTACPNPFLHDFIRVHGRPHDPEESYEREPFAVDTSVGKTDALYRAHGYHTKVPHLAIVPSILHYTKPGDIVLDGFCGSGMTGLAAQWCGTAPKEYRQTLETEWKQRGHSPPEWGSRRVILNDLGPAASFIAAGYNLPFDVQQFQQEATRILHELEQELGWMYETIHTDGKTKGRINYTVWSEVFTCPQCIGEIVFTQEALDLETKRVREEFPCPHCNATLNRDRMERTFVTSIDPISGELWKRISLRPVLVNYNVNSITHEKLVSKEDLELLHRIDQLPYAPDVPSITFPFENMWEASRIKEKGFSSTHHLFLPRATHALAALWRKADNVTDIATRRILLWFVEQATWGMSVMNRYQPIQHGRPGGSQVNRQMSGVYYVSSQISECSPWYILHDEEKNSTKLGRLQSAFSPMPAMSGAAMLQTGDCAALMLPGKSVDYIFTDPPFGDNFAYWELNFLVESWYGILSQGSSEVAVDRNKMNRMAQKTLSDYQRLMQACFEEYQRVLKPGRWLTVVFSNSKNSVWRALQEALSKAGFVVADVRTLDKQQRSFKQVTSSAVKQDLVISAYKPTEELSQRFALTQGEPDAAWAFVREHLANVPVFVGHLNECEVVVERTAQMLLDRMIAFHVQRNVSVPVSGPEFFQGLAQRFPEREGMYFLPDQVSEYDRKRTTIQTLRQLDLFVKDEVSAVQWVRRQLHDKPQSFQDLQPQFMRELQAWAKHERPIELKEILAQNFLRYEGIGPVPSQIHSYLSSNYKDLRNLEKEDPSLVEKAVDRWYVPDPNKQGDLEQLRKRALLKEFDEYKTNTQRKLKVFRTEAIRAGFQNCWQHRDYDTIIQVAEKLPDTVLQEDEKLLMYYDNAMTRKGDG